MQNLNNLVHLSGILLGFDFYGSLNGQKCYVAFLSVRHQKELSIVPIVFSQEHIPTFDDIGNFAQIHGELCSSLNFHPRVHFIWYVSCEEPVWSSSKKFYYNSIKFIGTLKQEPIFTCTNLGLSAFKAIVFVSEPDKKGGNYLPCFSTGHLLFDLYCHHKNSIFISQGFLKFMLYSCEVFITGED